jgi:hypothetical protein
MYTRVTGLVYHIFRAFAGEDHEVAVVPPEARKLFSRFDGTSAHYEILIAPE